MRRYQKRLRSGLESRGWELVQIDSDGIEWWAAEVWTLRSVREHAGREVVVGFVVDPISERAHAHARLSDVSTIVAIDPPLQQEVIYGRGGDRLSLHQGLFHVELESFLDALDRRRAGT